MKLRANAKINLTLDVLGKREDGYHLIDSVFQSVSLCDFVVAEKSDVISVKCSDNTLCDKNNIAYIAAEKFFGYAGINGGVDVTIEKHIPLASGMGGGSADAAAVIKALNKIYETNFTESQLCDIALSVGADVPFCIRGGTARVGGIGEKLNQISPMPECYILLIKSGKKNSTADMYKKIDLLSQNSFYTDNLADALLKQDFNSVCNNVSNAFMPLYNIDTLLSDIKSTKPSAVSLSGSGPTVFAIYKGYDEVNCAFNVLKEYNPIITTPANKGVIFE